MFFTLPPPAALAQVLFIAKCSHYGPYLLHTRSPDLGLTDSDRHPGGGPCGVEKVKFWILRRGAPRCETQN